MPDRSANGRNTTQVVAVEPMMDWSTTPLPFSAASWNLSKPLPSVERKQLSSTTIELSTIIPTPSTRLLSVITFREKPMTCIIISATRMDIGMDVPTIIDAFQSPKNRKRITMEMITAMIMVWNTDARDSSIISLLSFTTTISSSGLLRFNCSIVRFTALDTSPAELSCCFLIPREMTSSPL